MPTIPRYAILSACLFLTACIVPVPIIVPVDAPDNCSRPLAATKQIDRSKLAVDYYEPTANDGLSAEERRLYDLIMDYRQSIGLPTIPLSKSLTLVAGRHAEDTQKNLMPSGGPKRGTNFHSWSDMDYYPDHRNAKLMWQAPRRLGTPYCGNGYEISAWGYTDVEGVFRMWASSSTHRQLIANTDGFRSKNWQAIGVGIARGGPNGASVYHVWFGEQRDPAGRP
ncbi:CAP domain-containing protein [Qingshengfaniella alkalisoli]|uniref:Cysteine-rich secretory protein family protein n=1 Tax=Qingshengfaniella alkalisoli TaxID=2599296 RepID=A0A5B8IYM5_9RHOB|nr:CAP domain-containing protein [Qingshengfaniella alkalisoli]QDY69758.1 hypothetical protein FPZ52_09080 [Qingshengfaniella alkalisoli]